MELPTASVYTVNDNGTHLGKLNDPTITWESSNTAVATIEGTTINFVGAGISTITAFYAGNETQYKPSSNSFELTVTGEPFTSAGALNAAAIAGGKDGKPVTYNFTNTKVVFVNGKYNYIADETGYALLYKENLGLTAGKVITGTLTGTAKTYYDLPEIEVYTISIESTLDDTETPIPTTITIDQLADNVTNYIKIENAKYVSANINSVLTPLI